MYIDEKKKVLFVIGMETELDSFIKKKVNINPENSMILQSYGPVISQPFGDLMRDIIISVYQENVDEIVVVASEEDQKNAGDILSKIVEKKELQENIQMINYLLENGESPYPEGTISEWIEGGKTLTEDVQNSVNVIRNHPLMPPHVKVRGIFIEKENDKQSDIEAS
jgi:carbonic anhydrase